MNAQQDGDTRYLSYMLRLWRTRDSQGQPLWCGSLEEPYSHQTARFGDVCAMFAFLQSRLGIEQNREPAPEAPLAEITGIGEG